MKSITFYLDPRPPDRPACVPALWVDGGGDKDCGELACE